MSPIQTIGKGETMTVLSGQKFITLCYAFHISCIVMGSQLSDIGVIDDDRPGSSTIPTTPTCSLITVDEAIGHANENDSANIGSINSMDETSRCCDPPFVALAPVFLIVCPIGKGQVRVR